MQCPCTFDHRESIITAHSQYLLHIDKSSDPQACSAVTASTMPTRLFTMNSLSGTSINT